MKPTWMAVRKCATCVRGVKSPDMPSVILPASSRKVFLTGLAIAISGAVLFSAKAIVAKLIASGNDRAGIDAVHGCGHPG